MSLPVDAGKASVTVDVNSSMEMSARWQRQRVKLLSMPILAFGIDSKERPAGHSVIVSYTKVQ